MVDEVRIIFCPPRDLAKRTPGRLRRVGCKLYKVMVDEVIIIL